MARITAVARICTPAAASIGEMLRGDTVLATANFTRSSNHGRSLPMLLRFYVWHTGSVLILRSQGL